VGPVLDRVSVTLEPGEAVGVIGRSGTGKSTLLHAVAGLVPWHRPASVRGSIRLDHQSLTDLDPGQRAHLVATCLDRAEAQLFLPTPGSEREAARRLYGEGPLANKAWEALGLGPLLERRTAELSSGERQRLALATSLAACPRPVLLDEPTAHLDDSGVKALVALLRSACDHGGSVMAAEQAGWRVGEGISRWLLLADGRLGPCGAPERPVFPEPPRRSPGEVLLRARGLVIRRGDKVLARDLELDLREGEVVLLTGANGVGKTSLARVLAGVSRPHRGAVERPRGGVALMLPSAELQLFGATVAAELASSGVGRAEAARVLRRHRLDHLAARAPWTLSRGERQRLVHAALDLIRPAVMIVDEPGQGLDPADLVDLIRLVHRRAERGRAYLIISHRTDLATAAHRRLELRDGRLACTSHQ